MNVNDLKEYGNEACVSRMLDMCAVPKYVDYPVLRIHTIFLILRAVVQKILSVRMLHILVIKKITEKLQPQ